MDTMAVRNLSKTFGGQRALDDVTMSVRPGEVHGLVGENGCGKSTLIKVLAGYHDPDPGGHLEIHGQAVDLPLRAGQFESLGLSFVHQDLGLLPTLTVVENFRVSKISASRQWHISWRREKERTEQALSRYGLSLDVNAKVADLTPVTRALLAIVRAVEDLAEDLAQGATRTDFSGGLLILDEPTVFLPKAEKDQLMGTIREIVSSGASVLIVTHDLDEVLDVSDRITVMRDGRVVGTMISAETSKDRLVEMMIGRQLQPFTESMRTPVVGGSVDVAVEQLSGEVVETATFHVKRGEILGLTGLVGSGFGEVPYLMFGASRAKRGRLTIDEATYDLTTMRPSRALRARMALIPADRVETGGVGSLSAGDNVMFQVLRRYVGALGLNPQRMARDARTALSAYDVRPAEPGMLYEAFSGGNQQKILLAKWLQTDPALLILHEPTQGVDIGARQQVFEMIRKAAAQGTAVICASSDLEQLASICDRVLVFCDGKVSGELAGNAVTKERLSEWCLTGRGGEPVLDMQTQP